MIELRTEEPPKVIAVISTFRPDEQLIKRVISVAKQVTHVVIVDDGACEENVSSLRQWFGATPSLSLIHNEVNLGLATSLNIGVNRAVALGAEWILTLDDDTLVMPMMVERLFQLLTTAEFGGPVGVIALSRADSVTDRGVLWKSKRGIITSGSLFSVATFKGIRGFREDFFIDMVDYDFCLQIRKQGLKIILVNEEGFYHAVGVPTTHQVMGQQIVAYNHAPFRRYYIVRNSSVLIWEYLWYDPLFSAAVLYGLLKMLLKVLCFEKDKAIKLKYMAHGFQDALRGNMGKRVSI
jgi:rhamnosyltransferase